MEVLGEGVMEIRRGDERRVTVTMKKNDPFKFNNCLFVLYILFYRMKGKLASKRCVAAVRHFSRIAFVRSFSGFVGRLKAGLADERVSIMLAVQGSTNTR